MAMIIRDSFDFYASIGDLTLNSFWDTTDAANNQEVLESTNTRFNVGQAVATASGSGSGTVQLGKAYTSDATLFLVFALNIQTLPGGTTEFLHFRISDGATVQCSFAFRSDGAVTFYRGDRSTLLGTWTSAFSAASWSQVQFKIVINNTTGSFEARKNGNTSDDFSLTGQNNRSTANNQGNKFELIKTGASSGIIMLIDDFAAYTGTSGAPWNDWVGDIRSIQLMANADTAQKQFTANAATVQPGINSTLNTRTVGANTQSAFQHYQGQIPGTVSKATINLNAGITGHINVAIFDSSGAGGGPGSVITNGTGTALTNPGIGSNDITFGTPPTLLANTAYWIVFLTDVSTTLKADNTTVAQYTQAQTYGSGFASPMTLTTTSGVSASCLLTVTPPGNYAYVQEQHEDGTLSFVQDGNVGDVDLYDLQDLTSTPSSILGVSIRGFGGKSDAGARTGCIRLKSGATFLDQTTFTLATTMGNMVTYQDVDPNTSAAWTASGVNALQAGPKVVS